MPDLQLIISNQIGMAAAQTTLILEEAITNMKISGMADIAIRQSLLDDLSTGGPLFGGFRSKLRSTVKNGVEYSSNISSNGRFVKAGVEEYQWVSIGDGKVCPDCEERHGITGTNEFFDIIGREKSGFSICGPNCRCIIVPSNYKGENLDKPLVKAKPSVPPKVIKRGIDKFKVRDYSTQQGRVPLSDLKAQQGWNKGPRIVDSDTFNATKGETVYRGFNGNIRFRDDYLGDARNQWVGEGIYGRGDYFGAGNRALAKAEQFSSIDGDIIQARIDPNAKIIQYNDLIRKQKLAFNSIDNDIDELFDKRSEGIINSREFKKEYNSLTARKNLIQDEGAFAVSEGYQGAYVKTSDGTVSYSSLVPDVGADELIIYDRSILIVNRGY